ncbi:lipopolysaccharide transport system ATP-binding protein [Flavobacterium omnivorum]|uniref:Lipopolysaccharide transport system ATP-binding protein n=1 Tax=Flavobacterium omnivorum TaxID=178355 RepID=A0A1G8C9E8_9FLAO|nr:ABC transporter ATP-binding protein [Flavobacterium omnivorum]SDH42005.1 lipopolysaccharide transport system ATP-binding protein [Flavobacterium omnivorum]
MKDIILKAENISKQYRLGQVGTGTMAHDLNRWWHQVRGKEDPYLKIGDTNDRSTKGTSDYVWALQNINFEVERGEILGIIGKNGAGKSTLLKILSRVTAPTTGSIKFGGRVASLLEVGTGFNGEMTGRENIYLNGAILGMTKKEIKSKIDEIIEFSGCERYIDTPVKRYSSGMYVRLAFAVAAFLEPEILIVDEVLAVGDAEFQKKAIGKMKDISNQGGRTVLFVSHNMAAVKQLCTRGIVLENGKVVFEGGITEAVDSYINSNQIFESIWNKLTPNNSIAYFTHASIINSENKYVQVVSNRKQCFLKLKVVVEAKVFDGTFAFEIVNQMDQSIFVSHDFDMSDSIREAGCFEILIPLPKFLRAGNYFVNLGSNIRGFTTLEYFPNVLGFEYIDELYGGQTQSRPGTVFIPLKWEINKI